MIKFLLASLAVATASLAFAEYTGNGYYRVRNLKTERWVSVIDNKGKIEYANTTADLGAIKLQKNFDAVCSDPATILHIMPAGSKIQIEAQGTGIEQIIGHYADLTKNGTSGNEPLYLVSGTYMNSTKYLGDASFFQTDLGSMGTNSSGDYRRWFIFPLSDDGDNFFGVKPTVEADGKYYATMYGAFPFSAYSDGVKAYYISGVYDDMVCLEPLEGTVAPSTPVIFECSSESPASNRLHIGGTADKISGNHLTGVYFCSTTKKNHLNMVEYDSKTMRVLGLTSNGELGFITDSSLEYIPANTCYLKVAADAPAELRCVDKSEYTAGVDEIGMEEDSDAPRDVYNIYGMLVAKGATAEQIEALPHGIYIINGKKVMK